MLRALGLPPDTPVPAHGTVLLGRYLFLEVPPASYAALAPDMAAIRALVCPLDHVVGLLVTAQGMAMPHAACDAPNTVHFSVRHFAPGIGIAEDIATGSIQAFLYPYWEARLALAPTEGAPAPSLNCWQHSRRGGLISSRRAPEDLDLDDGAVIVSGRCALSLRGTLPAEATLPPAAQADGAADDVEMHPAVGDKRPLNVT